MGAAQQVDERAGGGDGLQAAAVAAAADDAVGVDEHVAELAGQPGAAAVQAAVEDQPGADAGGDLQVDRGRRRRGRRRTRPRRARRGSRRCRPSPGSRAACAARRRRSCRSSRAGSRTSRRCRRPGRSGPGRPMPAPITVSRATPASASVSTTSSAAISRPSVRVVVGVQRARALGEDRAARGRRPRRAGGEWPKSTPTAAPALASNESRIGGRPPWAPYAEPGSGRSTTSPSACRSATRLETVERLSPVRRAISAREICPSSRSARITRRRLRRRSDSSEPARPGGMESVSLEREGTGSSTYGRTDPPSGWMRATGTRPPARRRAGDLVVPGLLLRVPEHPEVAEEQRDRARATCTS